jgi:lysophospholipase L1-like esterase
LLAGIEMVLRLTSGFPSGFLDFFVPGPNGLYPPAAAMLVRWGPIRYEIETDAHGMRRRRGATSGGPGVVRIAAIGDSVTDGFFVDSEATFPALLERRLEERGYRAQVLNAARGGGSIDKEYAILREIVLPLKPAMVLLTFVTNDIADIRERRRDDLLRFPLRPGWRQSLAAWATTRTAIGETLARMSEPPQLARARRAPPPQEMGASRYRIPGGDAFRTNAATFMRNAASVDGIVLGDDWSSDTRALVDNYLFALGEFAARCREDRVALVLVYFPAYAQVYDVGVSMRIRDVLRDASRSLGIAFVDLTPSLRREGATRVLHLAPLDYHMNPDGNRVIADTLADELIAGRLGPDGAKAPPRHGSSR